MTRAIVGWMERPSSRTALIDAATDRSWTYVTLATAVRRVAATIASERKSLVACLCRPNAESVIGYLAALAAGHAVMLLDGGADAATTSALIDRYQPEYVLRDGQCETRAGTHGGELHPDLAVLLCTSGSTASPKLVRLSARNLDANAAQIIEYLEIDSEERALQSVPFHHAYGLSVLNTHLVAGATVVLTPQSIIRPELWDVARRYECTSFAGVPYTFAILAKVGMERFHLPSLRTLTQAGGPMAPARVLDFAALMRDRGGRLVVMYGQTEATARIAYLPPGRVFEKPASIGVSVPRGKLSLADDGELVYEGPNVMLGYATRRADLAQGDGCGGILATGDLGAVDGDGYFSIVGRKRRIAKLCGQRVNLDELEALIAAETTVAALELDEKLVIVRVSGASLPPASELARAVARRLALPTAFIEVDEIDQLPLTGAGKTDYARLARERSVRS